MSSRFTHRTAGGSVTIRVSPRPLSVARAYAELQDSTCGGVVLFVGRVRPDRSGTRRVRALNYETHRELAERAFEELARQARKRFHVRQVVLWHRYGVVGVGEPSVIVGVSAPHRSSAFDAARFLIEQLKRTAPIWKHDLSGPVRAPKGRVSTRTRSVHADAS